MDVTANDFRDVLDICCRHGGDVAFEWSVKNTIYTKTYDEFAADVAGLGTYFFNSKLRDARIAVMGEDSYWWIVTYFAAVLNSSVIVPIDKELSGAEIANLLGDCKAKAVVYSNVYEKTIDGAAKKLKHRINMRDLPDIIETGAAAIAEGCTGFTENEIDDDELCAIIYTSGTTGKPKGVMLSQRNIVSDAVSAMRNVTITGTSLLVLPLHHTYAFTAGVVAVMLYGYPIAISKSLRTFLSDLKIFKPQNMFLVPQLLEGIYKKIRAAVEDKKLDKLFGLMVKSSKAARRLRLDIRRPLFKPFLAALGGNLNLVISGGAPLDPIYIDRFDELGIQVLNGYGITECAPIVAVNCNDNFRIGSVGYIMDCNAVKVINEDENGNGEICVQGTNVMLGYLGDPKDKMGVFEDGWFRTGDLGYVDEDDFLYITGRKKNLIILSNGKNIYPEEIEQSIMRIKNVIECVVYAEDDMICAEIYAEDQDGIKDAIMKNNRSLPLHRHVKKIKFRDTEFEKTTTHKIKRG